MLWLPAFVLLAAGQKGNPEVLSLVAVGDSGQNVVDLKVDELQVLDNGKTRPIRWLKRVEDPTASPTVILLDLMNTQSSAWSGMREKIPSVMQSLGAKGALSLYLLTGDGTLQEVHGSLDEALRGAAVTRPAHLDSVGPRVKATYTALAALSTTLTTYPGRKNIVWITHGVPIHAYAPDGNAINYLPTLKELAGTLGQVNIVLYAVEQLRGPAVRDTDTSGDTLRQFTSITGGRVYPNDKVEDAVGEALRDTASGYLLAFDSQPDGKFHKIHVNCTRPGVRIQTSQGYFAKIGQASPACPGVIYIFNKKTGREACPTSAGGRVEGRGESGGREARRPRSDRHRPTAAALPR